MEGGMRGPGGRRSEGGKRERGSSIDRGRSRRVRGRIRRRSSFVPLMCVFQSVWKLSSLRDVSTNVQITVDSIGQILLRASATRKLSRVSISPGGGGGNDPRGATATQTLQMGYHYNNIHLNLRELTIPDANLQNVTSSGY